MNDPLQSGLAAGQAAYTGTTPQKRLGISAADLSGLQKTVTSGLTDAAAQRKILDTNAAKQAAGKYPTSGTSAAMYNYMRGQGGYPVNAVPSNQPVNTGTTGYGGITPATSGTQLLPSNVAPATVTRPPIGVYENPTTVPKTQTEIANTAKTTDTKMGKVTQPNINMPKPGLVNQLLATAGPLALGYYALDKAGGIDALSKGWDKLWGSQAPAPVIDASSIQASLDALPPVDVGPAVTVAENVTPGVVSDAGTVDAGFTAATSDAGITGATTGGAGLTEAAGWDAATAGEYGGPAAGTLSDLEVAQAATDAGAAGLDWATMAAEYGPYVAAAMVADKLTGGHVMSGLSDAVSSIGGAAEDVVSGIGGAAEDILSDAGDAVGCYITTAATKHGGQADDGEVLNTLRHFRDTYMRKDAEKNKDVAWYYKNAPKIVNAIDRMPEADAVYQKLYKQYILPAYHAIKKGENARAFKLYKSLVKHAESVAGLHRGKELTTRYANGGISVGSRYDPDIDGVAQTPPDVSFQPTVGTFAAGGISHLGGYSDGGRLLRGPGDGVSDSIPATIGGKQPARLADGEFVVPARIVSELGNGSTEAGARKLYAMMDRVQKARSKTVGKGKVAKNTRADKYLPG